jgi:hypothetical protein
MQILLNLLHVCLAAQIFLKNSGRLGMQYTMEIWWWSGTFEGTFQKGSAGTTKHDQLPQVKYDFNKPCLQAPNIVPKSLAEVAKSQESIDFTTI